MRMIREQQESTGKSFCVGLVEITADAERDLDRITAYEILLENLVAKESHSEVGVSGGETGIAILLSEQMPAPG